MAPWAISENVGIAARGREAEEAAVKLLAGPVAVDAGETAARPTAEASAPAAAAGVDRKLAGLSLSPEGDTSGTGTDVVAGAVNGPRMSSE